MLHNQKVKAEVYEFKGSKDSYEKLRYIAASKLLPYKEHIAGKGSIYIFIEEIIIRIADHEEVSKNYEKPDFNIINRELNKKDIEIIDSRLRYPQHAKQRAFALHFGLTVPKLKKLLSEDCFENIVENPFYPNTETKMIVVAKAINVLNNLGYNETAAVRQESYSLEDYSG